MESCKTWTPASRYVVEMTEAKKPEKKPVLVLVPRRPERPKEMARVLVDAPRPPAREPRPVATAGCLPARELLELRPDLVERQPDALGEHDERDAPERRSRVPPVPGPGALGADQPPPLVEPQRRGGHA